MNTQIIQIFKIRITCQKKNKTIHCLAFKASNDGLNDKASELFKINYYTQKLFADGFNRTRNMFKK